MPKLDAVYTSTDLIDLIQGIAVPLDDLSAALHGLRDSLNRHLNRGYLGAASAPAAFKPYRRGRERESLHAISDITYYQAQVLSLHVTNVSNILADMMDGTPPAAESLRELRGLSNNFWHIENIVASLDNVVRSTPDAGIAGPLEAVRTIMHDKIGREAIEKLNTAIEHNRLYEEQIKEPIAPEILMERKRHSLIGRVCMALGVPTIALAVFAPAAFPDNMQNPARTITGLVGTNLLVAGAALEVSDHARRKLLEAIRNKEAQQQWRLS